MGLHLSVHASVVKMKAIQVGMNFFKGLLFCSMSAPVSRSLLLEDFFSPVARTGDSVFLPQPIMSSTRGKTKKYGFHKDDGGYCKNVYSIH
jgi:hypothetical protein